jgi:ABC-type phosphonate transport system ATPase subunit
MRTMTREEYNQTQTGKIETALHNLQRACGFDTSESATASLFEVLEEAVERVRRDWGVVDQSYDDGLAYNVNALLSNKIVEVLDEEHHKEPA